MFSKETERWIEQQFEDFVRRFPELGREVSSRISVYGASGTDEEETISGDEVRYLLRYLYANMPLSDAVDYPFEIFL